MREGKFGGTRQGKEILQEFPYEKPPITVLICSRSVKFWVKVLSWAGVPLLPCPQCSGPIPCHDNAGP
ncbi:unnamed protein product [Sphagnum troendelagicum]